MTTPKELVKSIADLTAEFNRKRQEMMDALKPQFHSLFTEAFEAMPNLQAVAWTQYTPYFNDGETCEFSRHEFQAYSKGDPEEDADDNDYDDIDPYEGDLTPDNGTTYAYQYLINETLPPCFPFNYSDEQWSARAKDWQGKERPSYEDNYGTKVAYYEKQLAEAGHTRENIAQKVEYSLKLRELFQSLDSIPEDTYENMFGDHAFIVVTRDGVDVREYDHD